MGSRIRKNKYSVIATCRRGFICLSLICALIVQPHTVLADDSFALEDSADAAEQNNTVDSADSSANIEDDRKEEAGDSDGVPADSMKSAGGEDERDNVPEAGSRDVNADDNMAASDDEAIVDGEDTQNCISEADSNEANAEANTDVNAEADVDTDANTDVDITANDNADTDKTEAAIPVLQSAEDSPAAESEFPSKFDLRDLGRVTPVKQQNPWGTCWAFAATAAAEISILSAMGKTYAETGLDLSERHLAWYVAQQVSENISASQAGEGLHLYDENPNNILLYGGKEKCAGTLYAQGIGPVPESEYPYRGSEGKLAYETLLAEKDAYINARIEDYRQAYYFLTEDELRSIAEEDYEAALSKYADYDVYSEFDD